MKKEVKRTLIFGMILIAIVICIATFAVFQNLGARAKLIASGVESLTFSREYPDVSENNKFEYITIEETLEIINKGTGIIYFSFPSCPWCQAYAPVLDEVIREQGIENVYYYNPKEIRANNTDQYKRLVELVGDYLEDDKDGNKRLYVPHVFAIKDGKVVGENNSMSTMSGNAKEYFTEQKRAELKNELNTIISKFSGSCNDTSDSKGC